MVIFVILNKIMSITNYVLLTYKMLKLASLSEIFIHAIKPIILNTRFVHFNVAASIWRQAQNLQTRNEILYSSSCHASQPLTTKR